MRQNSTISHHDNEAPSTPLVSDLVFDTHRNEWVVPYQAPQAAPPPPKTDLMPRVAHAGKNLVVGAGMIAGYTILIVIESGGRILMTIGELFQILWLSSRKPSRTHYDAPQRPQQGQKINVEVNVKIQA